VWLEIFFCIFGKMAENSIFDANARFANLAEDLSVDKAIELFSLLSVTCSIL